MELAVETNKMNADSVNKEILDSKNKCINIENEFNEKLKKQEIKMNELSNRIQELLLENVTLKGSEINIKSTANLNWEKEKYELVYTTLYVKYKLICNKFTSIKYDNNLDKNITNARKYFIDEITNFLVNPYNDQNLSQKS